ncbi:MotA/TolQ/ExbB proton channel family protein [Celerinatantimonas diazotrophica]|uniref:Outer membrane transport energization protein ExbB n=1 Tax=Celerinatantimonas diazotrophica TaxID=412034 RepID=A0A4R1JM99_9GAMM|nr:MotA/TolQ/ExbB proton channel family protein [Celerinatantimonas diazotrophica]TCK52186.1 outer membrane transport energization protein ExbB [Celerinatantimonas diazotrophica]CAG9296109.1 Tol-Pal system protein TolQ [Celerinatantimonas diazotrophica]
MKYIAALTLITLSLFSTSYAATIDKAADSISAHDQKLNQIRQHAFITHLKQQQQLLEQSRQRLAAAKKHQQQLNAQFSNNEKQLTSLSEQLRQRSGELGKVFDVLRGEAEKFKQSFAQSMTRVELGDRAKSLAWATKQQIPSSQDLTHLADNLLTQLQSSGEISQFKRDVVNNQGQSHLTEVTRVGEFVLLNSKGQYLQWNPKSDTVMVMTRQPQSAKSFVNHHSSELLIDPTHGQLLALQSQLPTLMQRIAQGGAIGYVIIVLGLVSLILALFRLAMLLSTETKVKRQLKMKQEPREDNPLGRILSRIPAGEHQLETLEIYIDEVVSQELPKLERSQTLVKLIAGVAPLLGLLGTVTGMIATFQAITLFGTGDPKMMASGISQALMTTVLGLIVAIPLLFTHNLLSTRAQRIRQILQQQTLALLADRIKESNHETA